MGIRDVADRVREDIAVVIERDPSVHTVGEALLAPHLVAMWLHRLSHVVHRSGHPVVARLIFRVGRQLSGGIEIHPGARIGRRLFIDHGCGTVIGETAVLGDDVTLYHQVTLGALGWRRDRRRPPGQRRHPKLGSGVVVGANSVILGPVEIGDNARIGARTFVVDDVPAGAIVVARASRTVLPGTSNGVARPSRAGRADDAEADT
ncbi:serine O-acetyltransferase EpsC [Kibdelosporangium phytohabitans]|uniref:serine O-acetyltransferase EpsC n=1 Tax=Kibdelosporangium phytohabitans TaxID=860235 RepID=UPI000A858629|nr:serine O-acetyltransferase EpsC [Kibdelosporangium phytohabitans]MBE1468989.1 serine O-acetyltransferase [Kibdelosporangium phytohabitans]